MYDFCQGVTCRHRAILEYFGQSSSTAICAACDVCLGGLECLPAAESLPIAQKILSCVVRLEGRFGADYTASVLAGSREGRVLAYGHDTLSTYGLLKNYGKRLVRDWIEQLVAQALLRKVGEYNTLEVTGDGKRVLIGKAVPRLLPSQRKQPPAKLSKAAKDSWEGVDEELFSALRQLRRELAIEKKVPAYVIFSDAALRDMARRKPTTLDAFLEVSGVGEKKRSQYGAAFTALIRDHIASA
ncbi:MAG: HRDC domain-containing protein [Verrucomicrobia bacterium]|nr:HRDC domain-containing protein [Verrucomicrobiota bacterium]